MKTAIAALLLLPLSAGAEDVTIRREGAGFQVAGWAPGGSVPVGGWSSIFTVYAGKGDVPPMLGSYSVENGRLVFRPRFPQAPGVQSRAVFHPPGGPAVEALFEAPTPNATPSTRVEHVYPSTDLLPDNQLKLYVHFSASMRRGEAWQRIHLLDRNGSPVELPFLELDQELWDRDYKRLTVLFDPGRIKRGLAPLAEAGPAIEDGKQYTLVIDSDWLDSGGARLAAGFRKPFRVGPADRTPPDPAKWRLSVPLAGTSDALVVEFPKSMDYALLLRLLEVAGPAGRVAGNVVVDRDERRWRLAPGEPWKPGQYRLLVDTAIEDLAGNRIGRPFDVDTFEHVSEHLDRKTIELPFQVRTAP